MKTIAINTAAAWGANLDVWQDGDIFRESNTDTVYTTIGDRLGYLYTQVGLCGKLAADQTWTGTNTFDGNSTDTMELIDTELNLTGSQFNIEAASATDGGRWDASQFFTRSACDATFNGILEIADRLLSASETVADANANLTSVLVHRVPTLTGNRTYTLPSGAAGQLSLLKRTRTADAFTAALNDGGGTIGTISASNAGWILAMCTGGTTWVVLMWGGTVTGISTST